MRILGLDVGSKTIGVAVSDPMGWTAQGVTTIERQGDDSDFDEVGKRWKEYDMGKIVVGLPLQMDGEEGPQARFVRDFVEKMKERLGIADIVFWDERLSTVGAERSLLEADLSRQKRKTVINKMAAVFILQGYLDTLNQGETISDEVSS